MHLNTLKSLNVIGLDAKYQTKSQTNDASAFTRNNLFAIVRNLPTWSQGDF